MNETIETKMGLEGIESCESKLRFTEERYRTIIRTSLDGFWIIDLTGRFVDVNDAYCSLIGYSREELLKMRVSDVEALETPEDTARHIALVMETGHARFETRHRRKDGRILDIEVSANYMGSGGGFFFVFLRDITERKRSEEKLTVISGALDQSPSPVIITDTAGRIEYVNKSFTETMGVTCEEAVGTMPCFLEYNESTKPYIDSLWGTIRGGRTWRGDVCCTARDGKTRWDLVTVSPIKDAHGEIRRFITVRIDDSERKRAEDALRESVERYRMIHSSAFDGIIIADAEDKITECNPSAEKMFGYERGELSGRKIVELMPQRFHALHTAGFKKFLETGESRSQGKVLEFEGLKKDGATFPIELIIGSFTVNGYTYITATLRDITVRKEFEEALRKSKEDLAEAQKVAHIGSWGLDLIENTVTWSDEMYRISGLDRKSFEGRHESFMEIVHPDDREAVERSVRKCFEGSPGSLEFRIVKPDKTVRTVFARCEVRCNSTGQPVTLFGTTQDITEQKAIEAEVIKVQKLESLGVLAGGIAHNFNNLLTGILGNIFLAKGFVARGDALKRLEDAERGIGMAKDLTSRLLTFSRGGSPVKQLASVSELVTESADFVLSGSRVRPEYAIPDGLWAIEADAGLIS
ncbi:MAG: PAS domain S-box protein [Deltaproteobacteria bacterium]|nr:PAS domain S-box protein [Deltaproteobacteria bacterium]